MRRPLFDEGAPGRFPTARGSRVQGMTDRLASCDRPRARATIDGMTEMLPGEDPDLAETWAEMSPEERLRYQLAEGEDPPADVSERARAAFRDHPRP